MPAFGVLLAVLILGPSTAGANTATLTGIWRSAVDETPLSSQFDESVWGKDAKSTRVVEMAITSAGEAPLTAMCTRIRIGPARLTVLVNAFTTAAATFAADRFTSARPPAPEGRTN